MPSSSSLSRRVLRWIIGVLTLTFRLVRAAWPHVRRWLGVGLSVLLALVVLFEEWGWRPLAAALAGLARWRPWARAEAWIASLPPYGALCVFALPSVLIFPLKLVALYLIATGHPVLAGLLFAGAKVLGTALLARLFQLTQPALMRIGWFARAYGWFMPWKEHLFAKVRATGAWRFGVVAKTQVKRAAQAAWRSLRPRALEVGRMARAQFEALKSRAATFARRV